MIKLKTLLQEGAIDRAAVDFLSQMVKKSKWKGKVLTEPYRVNFKKCKDIIKVEEVT